MTRENFRMTSENSEWQAKLSISDLKTTTKVEISTCYLIILSSTMSITFLSQNSEYQFLKFDMPSRSCDFLTRTFLLSSSNFDFLAFLHQLT